MKEAMFYEKLDKMKVQCRLCPNNCVILHGKRGSCNVRENRAGVLYSLVYGLPCTANPDPIEKKPLFHFLPGTGAYSIATPGCNLHCKWCQNWQISQRGPDEVECFSMPPEDVVKNALRTGCKSIAYTYVEPAIFYEYVLDTAKLARKAGLKNIMVTNGYLNPEPVKLLYRYIDACNVDLKGFTDEFYREYCGGRLKPILDMIKTVHKMGVWVELTTLMIPGLNDSPDLIRKQCEWIKELDPEIPLHFSRFFPYYKMSHLPPTPPETLKKAYEIAQDVGLKNVYVGNIDLPGTEDTFCPKCGEKVIARNAYFTVRTNKVTPEGKCSFCGTKIAGVFSASKKQSAKPKAKPAARSKVKKVSKKK
ncbi:AmmeMemoRadiSam system radical SAM enzyme [Candidatus Woesearchaeota archaeon]|nr:AmmeMemoRadiSam system radical SAM enzyme [Candidatus Woesearchaeota archaeon]